MSLGVLQKWCFPHLLVCQATFLEVQPEYISLYNSVKVLLPFQLVPSTPEKERGREDKAAKQPSFSFKYKKLTFKIHF